jgi:hypothetical protein
MAFCRGINWDCTACLKNIVKYILLIKYITIVLWRVAERQSYIEDEWCLKVRHWCCSLSVAVDGNNLQKIYLQCITSRMVPLLKVFDVPIQVRNVLSLTVDFKFLNFSSIYTFILFLKCLLTSCLTLFRLFGLDPVSTAF